MDSRFQERMVFYFPLKMTPLECYYSSNSIHSSIHSTSVIYLKSICSLGAIRIM